MENIKFVNEDGLLLVKVSGRVDSSSAPAYEAEIDNIRLNNAHEKITLDLDDLSYLSSAGLRVILRLLKNERTLSLINANSEVYEIFQITGFSEMLPISKAYRKISIEGCEVIGQGANGKVYRTDPDTIVKVYINQDALPDIERERELARKAFVSGIPTAIPYDVVKVDDMYYGSVFELLNAKSFAKLINADPDNLDKYVELSVDVLKKMHDTKVSTTDMPNIKPIAQEWCEYIKDYIGKENGEKLVSLINDVPVVDHMIHGDYHVKNIMMQNNEVLLIDMDTLCYGHPVFEFHAMYNAYIGYVEYPGSNEDNFLGIPYDCYEKLWYKSVEKYFNTTDKDFIDKITAKAAVLGYARILRRIIKRVGIDTEDGKKQYEYYKEKLLTALSKIDSLTW